MVRKKLKLKSQKLKVDQVKKLEKQIEEAENKWKRALADYQNLEKRIEKEKGRLLKFLNASLIDKLLSVLDDLERAETHLKDKGLTMAVNQFREVLKTEGVEEIKARGENFNPQTMDCSEMVKGSENTVVTVTLKGYRLNGQVLRPAQVKVGKGGK